MFADRMASPVPADTSSPSIPPDHQPATDGGAVEEDLDLDQQDNFTVIEASQDPDLVAELSEVTEGSTVIEVPVAYTELQTAETEPFVVDQREEEAEDDSDDDEDADDPDFDPDDDDEDFDPESEEKPAKKMKMEQHSIEVEKCSICGATVADLAIHIVNIHSGTKTSLKHESPVSVRDKREGSPVGLIAGRPRKRAYCKGNYQQIKPVLRYPCDACKHVSKTSEQLKKHMIVSHKGNKATAWMFCGECEYATRVEEELVNHVKMHQVFRLLKDDMAEREEDDEDEEEEEEVVVAVKSTTGLGNYDPNPMNCGDCDFETHYENELFEHLKMHLRKDANIPEDTDNEVRLETDCSCEAGRELISLFWSGGEEERNHLCPGGAEDDIRGGRLSPLRPLQFLL